MTAKMKGVLVTFSFILVLESVVAEVAAVLLLGFMVPNERGIVSAVGDRPAYDLLQLL